MTLKTNIGGKKNNYSIESFLYKLILFLTQMTARTYNAPPVGAVGRRLSRGRASIRRPVARTAVRAGTRGVAPTGRGQQPLANTQVICSQGFGSGIFPNPGSGGLYLKRRNFFKRL